MADSIIGDMTNLSDMSIYKEEKNSMTMSGGLMTSSTGLATGGTV